MTHVQKVIKKTKPYCVKEATEIEIINRTLKSILVTNLSN